MTAPVALVTGAGRGLGRETARRLALSDFTVLLGCRDQDRGRQTARSLAAAGAPVTPVVLDVTAATSLTAVAEAVEREHGRLDVLVNNSGMIDEQTALTVTVAQLRRAFEVNVLGAAAALHAMVPLLRRSSAPRVVNVSSTTASLTLTASGADIPGDADRRLAYSVSKAALNMMTVQYAAAFARDPGTAHIKINAAAPGYTATDMNAFRGTRTVQEGARIIVDLATLADDGPTGRFFDDQGPLPW